MLLSILLGIDVVNLSKLYRTTFLWIFKAKTFSQTDQKKQPCLAVKACQFRTKISVLFQREPFKLIVTMVVKTTVVLHNILTLPNDKSILMLWIIGLKYMVMPFKILQSKEINLQQLPTMSEITLLTTLTVIMVLLNGKMFVHKMIYIYKINIRYRDFNAIEFTGQPANSQPEMSYKKHFFV